MEVLRDNAGMILCFMEIKTKMVDTTKMIDTKPERMYI